MISGAEKLKQLAACVNEIRQKDGSIVKEYILNDPKIIEHIKSQIKTNNTVQHETIQKNITITAYQVDGITISNDNQNSKGFILNDQNDRETLNRTNSSCNLDSNDNNNNKNKNKNDQMNNTNKISHNLQENKCNNIIVSPAHMRVSNNEKGFQYNRKQETENHHIEKLNHESRSNWETNLKNYNIHATPQSDVILHKQTDSIQHQQKPLINLNKQISEENPLKKPLSGVALASATSSKINELASINNQFIGQVKQKIQKFQQQQTQKQENNLKKHVENKIITSPNSSNKMASPINSKQNNMINITQNNVKIEENLIKQINRNKFELRTKKGKALQFTITSDDPSESDIEEVKSILNKRFSYFEQSSSFNKKDDNFLNNDYNINSNKTSFQPKNTNNCSVPIMKSSPINQQHVIAKSGSMANFLTNQVTSNESIKDFQNNNSDSNRSLNYLKYLSHSKSISNITCNLKKENEEEKANITELNNYEEIGEQKLFIYNNNATMSSISSSNLLENKPSTQVKPNITKINPFKSMISLNNASSTSLDNLQNLNENNNENNFKNWYESNHILNKPRVDGNTYTKNTLSKVETNDNNKREVNSNYINKAKNLNRSLDQLDDRNYIQNNQKNFRNIEITPEMTEKLLLKLLLQQITNQTPNNSNLICNTQNFSEEHSNGKLTKSKIGEASNCIQDTCFGSTLKINLNNNSNNNLTKKSLIQKSVNNIELDNDSYYNQNENKKYSSIEIEHQNQCLSNNLGMNNADLSNKNVGNDRFFY